ncbi:MAG TPA: hypothetical protein PKV78_08580 [Methanoculleus thermophilus]|nr:hypothetical protein [Methanoculleus thermophilus]
MPVERRRELRFELSPTALQEVDGGLLIRNARLLAAGTWTDSQVQTPLFYPPDILRANAGNWTDNSYWSRHRGGVPRAITEKVGIISNQRFEGDAIIGDIFLHGRTQESRDTIAYVRWAQEKGIPVYTSVEHIGQETWNERERRYELTSLQMVGAAIVNVGACQTCTLPRENEGEPDMADDQKIKELEAALKAATEKITALEAEVKELKGKNAPAAGEDPKVKELEGKLADQAKASEEKIKELEAAIKKLEETPNPQTRTSGTESRELEPPAAVHVDPKSGEVYGL